MAALASWEIAANVATPFVHLTRQLMMKASEFLVELGYENLFVFGGDIVCRFLDIGG
jgi:hypothetical protein